MRVLITGHRGFVGRHLWAALDTPDNEMHGLDVKDGADHDCRLLFNDEDRGPAGCGRIPSDGYDLVLHCAAVVGGRLTIEGQPMAVATDLAIDSDLFQWALRTRPGRVVYFSSSAAYPIRLQGPVHHRPMREHDIDLDQVDQPDAVYGWVKLTGEHLARHARAEGLPVTVVRPFSGYGGDQDLDYPFPSFVDRAVRRMDPFPVWGSGAQVRDWVHIDDVVGAVLELVARRVDGPVNLCTGRGVSMDTLARMCMEAVGYEAPIVHVDGPEGVLWRVGDPAGMDRWYRPTWTLDAGVADAVDRARLAA